MGLTMQALDKATAEFLKWLFSKFFLSNFEIKYKRNNIWVPSLLYLDWFPH